MAEDYPVNIVFDAIDKVTAPMRRINARIERMTGPFRRLNNRMRALGRESGIDRLRESLGRVGNATGRVARQMGSLIGQIGLVGAVAGGVFAKLIGDTAAANAEIQRWSDRLGISTRNLSRLIGIGKQFGVQQDAMIDGLKEMSLRTDEFASTGKGESAETFRRLGLSREQLSRVKGDTSELFGVLTSRIRKVQDVAARQRIVDEIFGGQAGEQMSAMASASAEELRRLAREVDRTGESFGSRAGEQSVSFMNTMLRLQGVISGIRRSIAIALIPVLEDLATRLSELLIDNSGAIERWAEGFAANLPDHLRTIRDGVVSLWEAMQPLISSFQWMFDTFGTGETIVGGLALVIGGPLLASIGSLAAAIIGLGAAIGFTPIGWFLGAIAALATAAVIVYRNWDGIVSFFSEKLEAVRAAFDEGLIQGVLAALREFNPLALVVDAVNGIVEYFTGVDLGEVGSRFVDSLWDGITAQWRAMTDWLQKKMNALTSWMPDWITGGGDNEITVNDGRGREMGARERLINGAREAVQSSTRTERRESRVQVDFSNLPRGTRVEQEGDDEDVDLSMGRAMAVP